MTTVPRLKSIPVHSAGDSVIINRQALERVHLADEDGSVATLLRLLRDGSRDTNGLISALAEAGYKVSSEELTEVLSEFDKWRILEQVGADESLADGVRMRHESNLRFYDIFADMAHSSADHLRAISSARVLLLGAGGLGSGVLQSLVGLGIGRVRLIDFDTVEVKNLARQFTYGRRAVGRRKVDAAKKWANSYSSATNVEAVHRRVASTADVRELADGADVVICAIDSPDNVHLLVNDACYKLGIPFVAGGLAYSTLCYWSVEPGRSACRLCLEHHRVDELQGDAGPRPNPLFERDSINRATGPAVQVLSGLMTFEAMRFVTRSDPPVALACYHILELADGMRWDRHPWEQHPKCELCGG